MHSQFTNEASSSNFCFQACCLSPLLPLPESSSKQTSSKKSNHHEKFEEITASSLNTHFTNHESLPSLRESFSNFNKSYPLYSKTRQADRIRAQEYHHLALSKHVCLDYVGHCLFSYAQIAPPPSSSTPPQFDISYKSAKSSSKLLFGEDGLEVCSEMESKLRKRIMNFMNISETEYAMVFTANQSSAFKIIADSYPFQSNKHLVTVYDYQSEAVEVMIESSKKKGAKFTSAEFSWPNLRIQARKLRNILAGKSKTEKERKNRGLFVFPLQSRMSGVRYSYLWMTIAQENGWHVLLDACALGPKAMETLGLSLFKPDFIICSFYRLIGQNPSGFGCFFVKKSSASVLQDLNSAANLGIISIVPIKLKEAEEEQSSSEIVESSENGSGSEIECSGLNHADSLGLILISSRARFLINWMINAFINLQHPNAENGYNHPLVRIYGPKIRFDRGPCVAFNLFDWKGQKIDPKLVQKLADRHDISLSCGVLDHVRFSDKGEEEREMMIERGRSVEDDDDDQKCGNGVCVLSASMGYLTDFEDVYRVWVFVSLFLDADFEEKEKWRFLALNQKMIEV